MMNRRQLGQIGALGLGAGSGLLHAATSTLAAAGKAPASQAAASTAGTVAITAGKDYLVVKPPAPVEAPAGKIEVVEFFWYKCPHCFHFEPLLEPWVQKLPQTVAFRRVPVGFNPTFIPLQKLYYTIEAMGLVGSLHSKIFNAIHLQNVQLDTDAQIAAWIAKQGVDAKQFAAMYSSFAIASKATRASKLQDAYQIDGVPAMGVAGQFLSNGGLAGNMPRLLQVINTLIAQQKR